MKKSKNTYIDCVRECLDVLMEYGDEDLYVIDYRGPAHLYRNDQTGGDYLALELEGTDSNRDAIGARVHLTSAGLPDMHRMVQSGSTTSGGHDLTLYFGVTGRSTVDSIVIDWPSGATTVLTDVATNQRLTIIEDTTTIFADGFESGNTSAWSLTVP